MAESTVNANVTFEYKLAVDKHPVAVNERPVVVNKCPATNDNVNDAVVVDIHHNPDPRAGS